MLNSDTVDYLKKTAAQMLEVEECPESLGNMLSQVNDLISKIPGNSLRSSQIVGLLAWMWVNDRMAEVDAMRQEDDKP